MAASFCMFLAISGLASLGATGQLKPEYDVTPHAESTGNSGSNFVFLRVYPLCRNGLLPDSGVFCDIPDLFYHSEVLVCPRAGFSQEEQDMLDSTIKGMSDFAEVHFLGYSTANCVELGYAGSDWHFYGCTEACCAVPHTEWETEFPLNAYRAVIPNVNFAERRLYIYGTGGFDGDVAYHHTCDQKCWSNWSGTDYHLITNNGNTFTSTVLFMVYGLSQQKPNLGPSDLITVRGHCPRTTLELHV